MMTNVPFIDGISGLAMFKLLELKAGCTNMIKVKFVRDTGFIDVTNNSLEPLIFSKDEVMGIVDLRCIGYYKVRQRTIQHHTQYNYEFQPLKVLCEEFK